MVGEALAGRRSRRAGELAHEIGEIEFASERETINEHAAVYGCSITRARQREAAVQNHARAFGGPEAHGCSVQRELKLKVRTIRNGSARRNIAASYLPRAVAGSYLLLANDTE